MKMLFETNMFPYLSINSVFLLLSRQRWFVKASTSSYGMHVIAVFVKTQKAWRNKSKEAVGQMALWELQDNLEIAPT